MNDSDDEHRRMGQRRSLGEQRQVEQDLIISRAIIDLFADPLLREQLRFRGGTALNKLHFPAPVRYSEDIDLVRTTAGPIGPILDRVREKAGAVARAWQFRTKPGCAETQVSGASGGPGCPDTSQSRDQHVGDRSLRCAASHFLPRGQSVVRWQCGNTNLLPRGDAGNHGPRAASAQ